MNILNLKIELISELEFLAKQLDQGVQSLIKVDLKLVFDYIYISASSEDRLDKLENSINISEFERNVKTTLYEAHNSFMNCDLVKGKMLIIQIISELQKQMKIIMCQKKIKMQTIQSINFIKNKINESQEAIQHQNQDLLTKQQQENSQKAYKTEQEIQYLQEECIKCQQEIQNLNDQINQLQKNQSFQFNDQSLQINPNTPPLNQLNKTDKGQNKCNIKDDNEIVIQSKQTPQSIRKLRQTVALPQAYQEKLQKSPIKNYNIVFLINNPKYELPKNIDKQIDLEIEKEGFFSKRIKSKQLLEEIFKKLAMNLQKNCVNNIFIIGDKIEKKEDYYSENILLNKIASTLKQYNSRIVFITEKDSKFFKYFQKEFSSLCKNVSVQIYQELKDALNSQPPQLDNQATNKQQLDEQIKNQFQNMLINQQVKINNLIREKQTQIQFSQQYQDHNIQQKDNLQLSLQLQINCKKLEEDLEKYQKQITVLKNDLQITKIPNQNIDKGRQQETYEQIKQRFFELLNQVNFEINFHVFESIFDKQYSQLQKLEKKLYQILISIDDDNTSLFLKLAIQIEINIELPINKLIKLIFYQIFNQQAIQEIDIHYFDQLKLKNYLSFQTLQQLEQEKQFNLTIMLDGLFKQMNKYGLQQYFQDILNLDERGKTMQLISNLLKSFEN